MSPEAPTRSFKEGLDAHAAGRPRSENPYGLRSPDHAEWEAGWAATCDLDEDTDPASNRDQPGDTTPDPSAAPR